MSKNWVRRALVGILCVNGWLFGSAFAATAQTHVYDGTIARALRLLPRQPKKVVVVDAETSSPVLRDKLPHVEAFINRGEPVVYLVRQGETLNRADSGQRVFDYVLATIIWHEMAHLDGADEVAAQQAEEGLWLEFVLSRRVDNGRGLRYLVLLKKRR
jgi:hypothetical protein